MDILLAPFYALYSKVFYRRISQSPLYKGLLYLLFLSAIATLILFFYVANKGVPQMTRFVDWAKSQMPSLTWAEEGLQINGPSPYTMVHPDLGPLVTFDMNKTTVTLDEMQGVVMFVTAQKVFLRRGVSGVQAYDLSPAGGGNQSNVPMNINPEVLDNFYKSVKPWLIFAAVMFFFPFFFIWKLIAAVLFSWVGLLINYGRQSKLTFSQVLNISCFTLTAATWVQAIQVLVPVTGRVPFGLIGSLIVTIGYLYFAIRKTEDQAFSHSSTTTS